MRMWNVDVTKMCRQHLLAEHYEMHMFVGAILKGKSISGYLEKGLVELHQIPLRHFQLITEMARRGYRHKSDLLPQEIWESVISQFPDKGKVDKELSVRTLCKRCLECRSAFLSEPPTTSGAGV